MSRTLRLVAVAVAIAGAVAPLSAAHAGPDPLCQVHWYEDPDLDPRDGTVSPGRAAWVC